MKINVCHALIISFIANNLLAMNPAQQHIIRQSYKDKGDDFSIQDWLNDNPKLVAMKKQELKAENRSESEFKLPSEILKQRSQNPIILNLSGFPIRNLEGITQIRDPRAITHISLANMGLTEIAPNTFSAFKNLQEIDLSQNKLTKIDTAAFNGLENLESLLLYANQIDSINRLDNLPKLKKLGLSNNTLTKIQPGAFDALKNLEFLQLDNNQLTSFDPALVKNLAKLRVLKLNGNKLTQQNKEQIRKALPTKEIIF